MNLYLLGTNNRRLLINFLKTTSILLREEEIIDSIRMPLTEKYKNLISEDLKKKRLNLPIITDKF